MNDNNIFPLLIFGLIFLYAIIKFAGNAGYKVIPENAKAYEPIVPKLTTSRMEIATSPSYVERSQGLYKPVVPKYTTSDSSFKSRVEKADSENLGVNDVKRAVAAVVMKTTGKTDIIPTKGKSDVQQQKSSKDRKMYYVAKDLPEKQKAANKLAEISRRAQYLLQAIHEQLDGNKRIKSGDGHDITDNMKQLVRTHYKKTVPFAEYHNPSDKTVGSNSDKGVMIETCLRGKYNTKQWNSDNTLFRVHTHELSHSADFEYREDGEDAHGPHFKRLHQYLLGVAENLGLYSCAEYTKSGRAFCGLALTERYCSM